MSELPIESKKYGKFIVLYDECDEEIVNKHTWGIHKGHSTFYAVTHTPRINGKQKRLYMHRLLTAAPPGMDVDHVNHVGWCNTRANLRVCSRKENCQNQIKTKRNTTTSRFKGVDWHKAHNKWYAQIQIDGKKKYLGLFTSEILAAIEYNKAALEFFGEFAKLNVFSDEDLDTIFP